LPLYSLGLTPATWMATEATSSLLM